MCGVVFSLKAFDTLDHKLLLEKLNSYGIRVVARQLFERYLSDRYQCVVVNTVVSEWKSVNVGVPEGSVLGPILFLPYVNDMPALTNISLWLQHNKLALTIDKTIIVSNYKNRSASNVCVQINESIFTPNTSYVYLGVIVDNKLNFVEQVIKLT